MKKEKENPRNVGRQQSNISLLPSYTRVCVRMLWATVEQSQDYKAATRYLHGRPALTFECYTSVLTLGALIRVFICVMPPARPINDTDLKFRTHVPFDLT